MVLTADCAAATEYEFVSTRGYVNLFPFALGLIDPTSDKLESILNFIRDESHVWSKSVIFILLCNIDNSQADMESVLSRRKIRTSLLLRTTGEVSALML